MSETFLGQVLIGVVIVLLILDVAAVVLVIKILLSLRRAARVLDKALDDIENFSKIIRNVSLPFSLGGILKKLVRFAASDKSGRDKQ